MQENLTGEHKIKKSDLKRNFFEPHSLLKVRQSKSVPIQGINSKHLKFQDSICAICNNKRTQQGDRCYDEFRLQKNEKIKSLLNEYVDDELDISEISNLNKTKFVNLTRYFAKHLGCQIDQNKFQIPNRLSRFVKNETDQVPVSVSVRLAPWEWQNSDTGEISQINGIGGMVLILSRNIILEPYCYQTAFMNDGLQFIISMNLNRLESLEIWLFYSKMMGKAQLDMDNDLAKHLGLSP